LTIPARPDPDALLASLHRDEARAARGRLKIFFGMCPGVGKTYAMLEAARQLQRRKVDVLVGIVETHQRAETKALLEGLPVMPRQAISYRGIELSEMDLEGILQRKPQLVLVDELAHRNAPGTRHPKRYQDVIELLENGIDVASTLNVQHIESRADAVRQITGIAVTETVPDSVVELAAEIELIDLTPEALLTRLREGKVYLGERADAAAKNFFKEATITALRELALRFTAERMDNRLREMRPNEAGQKVWRSGERLLVAVGPSPSSTQLVRWTRRLAASQGAAWLAVNVETSRALTPESRRRLDQNLTLARELGAEVLVTTDDDLPAALIRVARQNKVTQIVVGKSLRPRWRDFVSGGSLPERLLRAPHPLDLHVVPPERMETDFAWRDWVPAGSSNVREYAEVVAALAGTTCLAAALVSHLGYGPIGLLYLIVVIALGLRVDRGPVMVAGVLSALCWDFGFIPPAFTFAISTLNDRLLFATYLVAACLTGQLTARVKAQERHERAREERATALLHLTRALGAAENVDDGVFAALRQIDQLFAARSAVLLEDESTGSLVPHYTDSFALSEKEIGVAEWAWRAGRPAGRFTDTLPSAEGFHLPLRREDKSLGVLIVRVEPDARLSIGQRDLLGSFAAQIALLVERERLRSAEGRTRLLAESERLHRTLLDAVSHELKTPLAVLGAVAENLADAPPELRANLIGELRIATRRLVRLVDNLLDQTRLESGALRPHLDWCDAADLVNAAADAVADSLGRHAVELDVPADLPPFRADAALTEQVLANLLLNAALHTPAGTAIYVTAGVDGARRRMSFTIADRGPGVPEALRARLFDKFTRGDSAKAGGLGLGLSIVRGFVLAQGGDVAVGANPGGGAVFTVYLPYEPAAAIPAE
jgi:two-component system sensor histidine kinase KdpD